MPLVDVYSTRDSLRNQRFQQLLSSKLDSATLAADPNVAWNTMRDVIMSSALEAYGQRSKAQPDWFCDNVDLLLPAVAAKRSARLKASVRNSRSAHRELQVAKRTVQRLTRFAVSRYWENLSTRIQQCADCGDLHGLGSGIREAIGPIPKKVSPLLAADGALQVDTSAQLERWVDHYTSIYSHPSHVSCSALSSLQQLPVLQELDNPFTMEGVKLAIRGIKNNKISWARWHSPRDFEKWWQTSANGVFPHIHDVLE